MGGTHSAFLVLCGGHFRKEKAGRRNGHSRREWSRLEVGCWLERNLVCGNCPDYKIIELSEKSCKGDRQIGQTKQNNNNHQGQNSSVSSSCYP